MTRPDWPVRALSPTDVPVGLCAWDAKLLLDERRQAIADRPSLIAVGADEPDEALEALGAVLGELEGSWPVMLSLREPAFVRRLPEQIEGKLARLGRASVEILTLWVDDPADLKGGGLMQTLRRFREVGKIGHIGLGHEDVRSAEWIAMNTAARVIVLPHHLHDQAARYRALDAIEEHGMAAIALPQPLQREEGDDSADEADEALRFALGASYRVLPILDRPIPPGPGVTPMTAEEIERAWADYRSRHEEPEPLPRSLPPE